MQKQGLLWNQPITCRAGGRGMEGGGENGSRADGGSDVERNGRFRGDMKGDR